MERFPPSRLLGWLTARPWRAPVGCGHDGRWVPVCASVSPVCLCAWRVLRISSSNPVWKFPDVQSMLQASHRGRPASGMNPMGESFEPLWCFGVESIPGGHWEGERSGSAPRRRETVMGVGDKIQNAGEEAAGKVKETAGRATGNQSLEAEGRADQASANVKQAGEKAKDAVKDALD